MISRTLEKNGKTTTWTVKGVTLTVAVDGKAPTSEEHRHDVAAVTELVSLSAARLKQGWLPNTKPSAVLAWTKALEKVGVEAWQFVTALTDDELDVFYKQAIRDEVEFPLEVLRKRPTRALLAYLLSSTYLGADFSKAIKFITKDPEVEAWVSEVFREALAKKPTPELTQFAKRNLKNIEARKVEPEAPKTGPGDERSLLEAIAANPSDDAPRLVYADYLTERGSGWGEAIQVSCTLAKLEYGTPDYAPLDAAFEKLKKKHLKGWLEPIRPFITGWAIERGLLSWVDTQPGKFIEAAEAIALRCPRGTLNLGGLKVKELPALAASCLGRFKQVSLSQQRLDDAQMATLAASPSIAGVEVWHLDNNPFGDDGALAIVKSPHFAKVQELNVAPTISAPVMTSVALGAFLSANTLPSLRSLVLHVTSVGSAFDACRLELTYLNLGIGGDFDGSVLEAIARTPSLRGLKQLSIQNSNYARGTVKVESDQLRKLIEALPGLTHLTFATVPLSEDLQAVLRARLK